VQANVAVVRHTPHGLALVAPYKVRANWVVARFGVGWRMLLEEWPQYCHSHNLTPHTAAGFAAINLSEHGPNSAVVLYDASWDAALNSIAPRSRRTHM
jgi:hypothetical protein